MKYDDHLMFGSLHPVAKKNRRPRKVDPGVPIGRAVEQPPRSESTGAKNPTHSVETDVRTGDGDRDRNNNGGALTGVGGRSSSRLHPQREAEEGES